MVAPATAEIAYLCRSAAEYLRTPITPEMAVWSYSGVRPLHDDGSGDPSQTTRDYVLTLDAPDRGAGAVVGVRRQDHHLPPAGGTRAGAACSRTCRRPLANAPDGPATRPCPAAIFRSMASTGWSPITACALSVSCRRTPFAGLCRAYGTKARVLLGSARSLADLGTDFGAGLTEAELRYLIAHEWACTAADVVWRRTKLGLRLSAAEVDAIDQAMRSMAPDSFRGNEPWRGTSSSLTRARHPPAASSSTTPSPRSPPASASSNRLYPQPGWVEHDPEAIWSSTVGHRARGAGLGRADRRGHRRARHHQPARDGADLGPPHRQADPQRHRLAGPPDRPTMCERLEREGNGTLIAQRTGLLLDPVFLRNEDRVAAGQRARRPRSGRGRAPGIRHGRHVPALAADRAARSMPPMPPTRRARCCSTSIAAPGITDLLALFNIPATLLPRGARHARAISEPPRRTCSVPPSPSVALPATSRRR